MTACDALPVGWADQCRAAQAAYASAPKGGPAPAELGEPVKVDAGEMAPPWVGAAVVGGVVLAVAAMVWILVRGRLL